MCVRPEIAPAGSMLRYIEWAEEWCMAADGQPNILIWGDDIGISNLICYSDGLMGYRTPNIDRIADEGMRFEAVLSSGH